MEDYFRRGTEALSTGAYPSALRLFEAACKKHPADRRLAAYQAWARYMVLKSSGASTNRGRTWLNDTAIGNCKSVIRGAVDSARDFDDGYVFLGRILVDEGEHAQAVETFRRALRIDASNTTAQKLLDRALRKSKPPSRRNSVIDRVGSWWKGADSTRGPDEKIRPVRIKNVHKTSL